MLYSYFFNMLKVGVPGFTQAPQLLVYNRYFTWQKDRKNVAAQYPLTAAIKTEHFAHRRRLRQSAPMRHRAFAAGKHGICQLSICFPRNAAAVSASLRSSSPQFAASFSPMKSTHPSTSPSAVIGAATDTVYFSSPSAAGNSVPLLTV